MFNSFNKKDAKPTPAQPAQNAKGVLRETLFGDQPVDDWPRSNMDGYPWNLFVDARDEITQKGNLQGAIQAYKKITETPELESRHYLQAWHFLRRLNVEPSPEVGTKVYGVVVDVALQNGPEFVAAYANHHAHYSNSTGRSGIWKAPDPSMNEIIDALLGACQQVAHQIQPVNNRPTPPQQIDAAQISILTPGGIRHGMATFAQLSQNPSLNEIINRSARLMKTLVDKNIKK